MSRRGITIRSARIAKRCAGSRSQQRWRPDLGEHYRVRRAGPVVRRVPTRQEKSPAVLRFGNQIEGSGRYGPRGILEGWRMTDQISPRFHAELIVVLFDEHQDLRGVTEKAGVLPSHASAEHIEAVGKYLPIDLMRVLPRRMLHAA
jgi:hypothetical protein